MERARTNTGNRPYPVPQEIHDKLTQLRGLISRFVISQSLIALILWLVISFWFFGLCDYLPTKFGAAESPTFVRAIMLAILVGVSLFILHRFLWQLWRVRWTDSSLALLIENQYAEFQSSLITTVQAAQPSLLANEPGEEHPSRQSLLTMARKQAIQLMDSVDVRRIIRFKPLQVQLTALGIVLALSCGTAMTQPAWTSHWAKRFFALSDLPWPRYTELGVDGIELDVPTFTGKNQRQRYLVPFQDGIAPVPKGQACQLKSWAKSTGKVVPDLCTVYYRDIAGNRGRANMRRLPADQQKQPFVLDGPPLESISESLWLSIVGGDARISNLQLKSVEAPLATKLTLNVEYPEYLQRSTKTAWGKEAITYRTGSRLPQGSKLEIAFDTNKPITRCDFALIRSGEANEQVDPQEQSITLKSSSTSVAIDAGRLNGNLMLELRLWGADGVCSTRVQQFVIAAITDQAPQVDLVLEGIGTAITENAKLPVVGKIKDDYEVKTTWLETVMDENPVSKTTMELQKDGKAQSELDLKEQRDQGKMAPKVGGTIGLSLVAEDFADLTNEPHLGRSNPIQLAIVTPDQLLVILDRRELAMRARLEQIINEISQMRDLMLNMEKASKANTVEPENNKQPNSAQEDPSKKEAAPSEETDDRIRSIRMQILRSQQVAAQLIKSEGELRGVEKEINQINQELINNRIDSADRRTRLEDKIRKPLLVVLDEMWSQLATNVQSIERTFTKEATLESVPSVLMVSTVEKTNEVITALTAILNDMIDIQDFNELIDMVRGMVDDQSKVIDRTKQEKKKQDLELLK